MTTITELLNVWATLDNAQKDKAMSILNAMSNEKTEKVEDNTLVEDIFANMPKFKKNAKRLFLTEQTHRYYGIHKALVALGAEWIKKEDSDYECGYWQFKDTATCEDAYKKQWAYANGQNEQNKVYDFVLGAF